MIIIVFLFLKFASVVHGEVHHDLNSCEYWLSHLRDIAVWEDILVRIRNSDQPMDEAVFELKENIRRARERVERENSRQ